MVIAACKSGIGGAFPSTNARTIAELDEWMGTITDSVTAQDGPWISNLITHSTRTRLFEELKLLEQYKPPIVITALGSPRPVMEVVKAYGGLVFADVVNLQLAKKAAEAGVDGMACISAAIALLDATYDSFSAAVCTAGQQVDWASSTGQSPASCTQDLSGKDLQFSPNWSGNLNVDYTASLSSDLDLNLQLGASFTDSFYSALDLEPASKQSSFTKLNARIELIADKGWSVALVGKNLTDEKTTTWVNDVPFFRGAMFATIDPPRTFGVQAKYEL